MKGSVDLRHKQHVASFSDDDDDDEGRINFSVALSSKTTRTRNNKPKQLSHVIVA